MALKKIFLIMSLIIFANAESHSEILCESDSAPRESAQDSTNDSALESPRESPRESTNDSPKDYEFPRYDNLAESQSLLDRFALHNETYFFPIYYQSRIVPSPYAKPYKKLESKLQFSVKANIVRDLFWGVGAYFAYTQKSFFQIYSRNISSPFRSNDYKPEIMLYKPLDAESLGGFYNVRFGYRHNSNGETDTVSRGIDLAVIEIFWRKDFEFHTIRAKLGAWAYFRKNPRDMDRYLGYSDLVLFWDFLERNHISLTIGNLFHNYAKYKGNVALEYRFDLSHFAIFAQYFYGYSDNLLEYKFKKHGFGIGVAIAGF